MKLGLFMMPLHPPGSNLTHTLRDDLDQIVVLDRLGYQEAWIGEHFTAEWENIPAPDQFIAMALAMTKNIVLGTGVTCMPNHDPFMIAHRIAQLDHLAQGRFHWGVGSGSFTGDFKVFGFDPTTGEQRSMTRDALDTVLALWDDPKPGLYEHKHWRFTVPEPVDLYGLTRIHRRTSLGTALEEASGCSSESGIMVLEQKPARKQGAPNRCRHRTNPTVSASSLTTIAWWPMPACSCRPP